MQGIHHPISSVPLIDLIDALTVVGAASKVGRASILQVEALRNDHLLVVTGFIEGVRCGGGKYVLLQRAEHNWQIVDITTWKA